MGSFHFESYWYQPFVKKKKKKKIIIMSHFIFWLHSVSISVTWAVTIM